MNVDQAATRPPLARPLVESVVGEVLDALRAAEVALTSLWGRSGSSPDDKHAYDSIADLNEHALKDIGAPHWLVAQAAERREAQRLRWIEHDLR